MTDEKKARDESDLVAFFNDALGSSTHHCAKCDWLNGILVELIQELRVRMRPEYAMLIMFASADLFLSVAAEQIPGCDKQRGLLSLVNEVVIAMPFPVNIKPEDVPHPGADKERWDGLDAAVIAVTDFLIKDREVDLISAAVLCVKVGRAMGIFIKEYPEACYLQALGETLLSRQHNENMQGNNVTIVGGTLFGWVKRPDGTLN